jgi:NAD(P)H-hydrate epimerase
VREALRVEPPARVAILCGPGNNGGDGAVVARHLDAEGIDSDVLYFADPARLAGDAAVQYEVLERAGIGPETWEGDADERLVERLRACDWVLDGLLGTGLTRPVEGRLRGVIEAVNRAGRPVLALDLPSGLDCDTGAPLGVAVRARATATFVAEKRGFAAAREYTGEVFVVPIGVPGLLIEPYRAGD